MDPRQLWRDDTADQGGQLVEATVSGGAPEGLEVTMTWPYAGYLLRAPGDPLREGTVTLSGTAVDAGAICPVGQAEEITFDDVVTDSSSRIYRLRFTVTCSDGSGQFVVRDHVTLRTDGYGVPQIPSVATGTWTVIDGTEGYESLTGGGQSSAEGDQGRVTRTYTGELTSAD